LSYLASQNIAANVKLCGEFKAAENALVGKKSTNAKEYVDLQLLLARFRAPLSDARLERHNERRADIRAAVTQPQTSLLEQLETKRTNITNDLILPTSTSGLETKDHNTVKIVPYGNHHNPSNASEQPLIMFFFGRSV
jgi:hypothetical protein